MKTLGRVVAFGSVVAAVVAVLAALGQPQQHDDWLHRPLWMLTLNGAGVALEALGVDTFRLVGLDDLAPESGNNSTALGKLTQSLREDAHLNLFGKLFWHGMISRWIVMRARVLASDDADDTQLADAVVITGLPRTGTTFLHNLLSQDDDTWRVPRHWEFVDPIPSWDLTPGGAWHLRLVDMYVRIFNKALLPGVEDIHPMAPLMPEECIVGMATEFASFAFIAASHVSSFHAWVMSRTDHSGELAAHARLLRLLQRRDGAAQWPPGRRWLLKTPWYLSMLDEAREAYPDAKFIVAHRSPDETVASTASLVARMYGLSSDRVDRRAVGREQTDMYETLMQRAMHVRARDGWDSEPNLVVDVRLREELQADPMRAVERIYAGLGLPLSDAARSKMSAWLQAQQQLQHGKHHPQLRDFSLTDDDILNRPGFQRYVQALSKL